MAETKEKYNKEMVIGDIIRSDPRAEEIIKKHFGSGCYTCPGMNMESITFGAAMHNMNPDDIIKELNELE